MCDMVCHGAETGGKLVEAQGHGEELAVVDVHKAELYETLVVDSRGSGPDVRSLFSVTTSYSKLKSSDIPCIPSSHQPCYASLSPA